MHLILRDCSVIVDAGDVHGEAKSDEIGRWDQQLLLQLIIFFVAFLSSLVSSAVQSAHLHSWSWYVGVT